MYSGSVHKLFVHLKNTRDSLEGKYYTTLSSGILVKQVRLIIMCLNEAHSEISVRKYLSEAFPVQMV